MKRYLFCLVLTSFALVTRAAFGGFLILNQRMEWFVSSEKLMDEKGLKY